MLHCAVLSAVLCSPLWRSIVSAGRGARYWYTAAGMHAHDLPADRRRSSLALISLTLFFVLLPLTLSKPGLPVFLKADEAAYYLASLSVWHDRDLVCENQDVRRLFREYAGTDNLLLMSTGSGEPAYFSVPIFYPLLAAPLVGLLGANGMVMLNAGLLMAMVWMGVAHLRRRNGDTLSTLFSAGFFLLSTAFVYVFWLQPEVFTMACVMGAFFLVTRTVEPVPDATVPDATVPGRRLALAAAGAAALLATASYGKPMLVVLALPLLFLFVRARAWRGLAVFAATGLLTAFALSATAHALTEQAWPYFAPRFGFSVSSPVDFLERTGLSERSERRATAQASPVSQIAKSGKELRVTMVAIVLGALPEFLFGRHGGFFVYMPFAVLAILLFLLHERRSGFRWLILGSAALAAVLFVTLIRGHWLGGGGFVGNRYYTAVYPCFFFLVGRIRPAWLTATGYAAAAVLLGPLLITPLGAVIREPTLQAHVRNQPFPRFPLEWSLVRKLAGYRYIPRGPVTFHGRRDVLLPHRKEVWVHGALEVEINLFSTERNRRLAFDVRNLAPDNEIELCLAGDCRTLVFEDVPPAGATQRVVLEAGDGEVLPRTGAGSDTYRHRLTVDAKWGESPRWRGSGEEPFYLGAALVYLGTADDLARDLYAHQWLSVDADPVVEAGQAITVPVAVRNASDHAWPSRGITRVAIGHRWLDASGAAIDDQRRLTPFEDDVARGATVESEVEIQAPATPGRYILELDLLRQRVRWFSRHRGGEGHRLMVTVEPPATSPGDGTEPGS